MKFNVTLRETSESPSAAFRNVPVVFVGLTFTVSGSIGSLVADIVNTASSPSVMGEMSAIDSSGEFTIVTIADFVASSSSYSFEEGASTVTVIVPGD